MPASKAFPGPRCASRSSNAGSARLASEVRSTLGKKAACFSPTVAAADKLDNHELRVRGFRSNAILTHCASVSGPPCVSRSDGRTGREGTAAAGPRARKGVVGDAGVRPVSFQGCIPAQPASMPTITNTRLRDSCLSFFLPFPSVGRSRLQGYTMQFRRRLPLAHIQHGTI